MKRNKGKLTGADVGLLMFNALFLGVGILANLGFGQIGLDLYVVALLASIIAQVIRS